MDTNYVVELLSSEDEEDLDDIHDVQNNKTKSSSEVNSKKKTNSEDIIDIDDINSSQESNKDKSSNRHVINPYSISYKTQFEKFYRRCLKLDKSDGMKRVLERKLLPAYHNTEEKYLKSNRFLTFLNTQKGKLKTQENLKFSIVKELLDSLMNHQKKKKRIQPITISKSIEKPTKDRKKRPRELNSSGNSVKKILENNVSVQNVINLDDDEDVGEVMHNMSVVENFNYINVPIHKETPYNNFEVPIVNIEVPHNILEVANYEEVPIDKQVMPDIIVEVPSIRQIVPNHEIEVPIDNHEIEIEYEEENNLLTARNHIILSSESENESPPKPTEPANISQPNRKELEIKYWETMLRECQKKIIYYDELEVDFESPISPYVMVENWKARSVNIYKKLCQLTGSTLTIRKPKRIRLKVKEGHPAGPARMLEEWLNLNMDGGHYVLPDLSDVIQCVEQAVVDDGLDWSKTDVIKEARSLFVQCGTTIQKYRQRREWKDLVMSAEEALDPADGDPSLKAKLEMNRRIAKRKEKDLLEHYTNLELGTKRRKSNETTQNTSNRKLKSKENNNNYTSNKSNLREKNTIEKTAEKNYTSETTIYNISETLVDSTTPELRVNIIRLNNFDIKTTDSKTDDNRDESFIKEYDNDVDSTNEGANFDISYGHVDSTTSICKENYNHDDTTDLGIDNHDNSENNDNIQVNEENDKENTVIKQELTEELVVKLETSEVVDGTADFVKRYGHITEADIKELRTIIFSNEPTLIIDISDSDSETDGVTILNK